MALAAEGRMRFRDREEGGQKLAALLRRYRDEDPVVLALPRGGVPVGYQVARALRAPLEVLVARKLGAPGFPEYALGAIAEGGAVFVESSALREAGLSEQDLAALADREGVELARRVRAYRGDRPLPELRGRTVILVDDGIATGRTARAALRALRKLQPRRLVLAAPVVAADSIAELRAAADDLVAVLAPELFLSVGMWYERFAQTTDEEVIALLARARAAWEARDRVPDPWGGELPDPPPPAEREVAIPAGIPVIQGSLLVPPAAGGIAVFAHGSGSSRFSPRNRVVAQRLADAGLATLLVDLLTPGEEIEDRVSSRLRFDIELLSRRLAAAVDFVRSDPATRGLRVGAFGASSGAAAALTVAARKPGEVHAVVCRGGRPDLAGEEILGRVAAPTLLVVGGRDREVLALNRAALDRLRCEKRLVVIPGASHLFEEPGALDVVADLAVAWFGRTLAPPPGLAPAAAGPATGAPA